MMDPHSNTRHLEPKNVDSNAGFTSSQLEDASVNDQSVFLLATSISHPEQNSPTTQSHKETEKSDHTFQELDTVHLNIHDTSISSASSPIKQSTNRSRLSYILAWALGSTAVIGLSIWIILTFVNDKKNSAAPVRQDYSRVESDGTETLGLNATASKRVVFPQEAYCNQCFANGGLFLLSENFPGESISPADVNYPVGLNRYEYNDPIDTVTWSMSDSNYLRFNTEGLTMVKSGYKYFWPNVRSIAPPVRLYMLGYGYGEKFRGNLAIYDGSWKRVWHTNTVNIGQGPWCTVFQSDSNIAVYDATCRVTWNSNFQFVKQRRDASFNDTQSPETSSVSQKLDNVNLVNSNEMPDVKKITNEQNEDNMVTKMNEGSELNDAKEEKHSGQTVLGVRVRRNKSKRQSSFSFGAYTQKYQGKCPASENRNYKSKGYCYPC